MKKNLSCKNRSFQLLLQDKINPDLPSYVVGKTTDALFDQIEKEEKNIRENPVARTTAILKRVFGSGL
ncbi:MAG TPA: DUF4197 family protein [Flavitalea sp.]|nr:DUF4197 family protein [Flavitalea sp.]